MGASRLRCSLPLVDDIFPQAGSTLVRDSMSGLQGYVATEIALQQIIPEAVSISHDFGATQDSERVAVEKRDQTESIVSRACRIDPYL